MLSEAWVLFLEVLLSAGIAIAVTTWTISRATVSKSDLRDVKEQCSGYTKRVEELLATNTHDYGEAIHAIRQKLDSVECWTRDNLAPRLDLERVDRGVQDLHRRVEQIPALAVKVDTMWDFQMDRGRVEARERGMMKRESPLTLTQEGKSVIAPIMPEIKQFCLSHPELRAMSINELEIELANVFRKKILEEICEPNNIYMGACMVMIIEGLRLDGIIPGEKAA